MSNVNVWCYDDTTRIGIVENIQSLQWLEQYQDIGEFALVCLSTTENSDLLKIGRLIYKTDGDTCGVVEYVEINDSAEKATITVRGKLYAGQLRQRIVYATVNVSNVEAGMRSIVSNNLRLLPLSVAASQGYTETTETEITWETLSDALTTLAEASGLGYKVTFDPRAVTHTFVVSKGVDRQVGTGTDFRGYFGDDIGNLESIKILTDKSEYKNIAIVAGEGEGADRIVAWVIDIDFGDPFRREMYVDARDIKSTYSVATDTGEIDEDGSPIIEYTEYTRTEAEYKSLLRTRGREKLAELSKKEEITASVQVGEQFQYRTDFNLGDIVTVKSRTYGITLGMRISEVLEVYELTGYQCRVTLQNL